MGLEKLDSENKEQYIWRIGQMKDIGEIDDTWDDIAVLMNDELGEDLSSSAYRKQYVTAKRFKENVFTGGCRYEDNVEWQAVHDDKIEFNRWMREYSRDEEITRRIEDAIRQLPPIKVNVVPSALPVDSDRAGILCFGDEHYGCEFKLLDLAGNVINEYSPEVFTHRMNQLFVKTLKIIERENLKDLYVYEFGDFADGMIHISQLMSLRYGIVESTVRYSEYICQWLTELSKVVRIHFQMTPGNHTELRLINQPKGTFKEENMDYVVRAFIKARMAGNPNFEFNENPTKLIFDTVLGYNILGIHGECSNTYQAMRDFSNTYNVKINYFLSGHKHHGKTEDTGIDAECISVPSIIGVNEYSLSINKVSNAGALLMILEKGQGKSITYSIKLE